MTNEVDIKNRPNRVDRDAWILHSSFAKLCHIKSHANLLYELLLDYLEAITGRHFQSDI